MNMYDIVSKSVDGTEDLLSKLHCSQITKMPQTNLEDIYLLILHYYIKNQKGNKDGLLSGKEFPFGAKLMSKDGRGLIFKPNNLPEHLQKILVRYIKMMMGN